METENRKKCCGMRTKKTPNQIDVETFENISEICMKSG